MLRLRVSEKWGGYTKKVFLNGLFLLTGKGVPFSLMIKCHKHFFLEFKNDTFDTQKAKIPFQIQNITNVYVCRVHIVLLCFNQYLNVTTTYERIC